MSENAPEPVDDEPVDRAQDLGDPVRTGLEDVDAVLEAVEGLEGTPVDEHVPVFEHAHDRLRRALDGRTDA